jgi:signal transduction histidine kinase
MSLSGNSVTAIHTVHAGAGEDVWIGTEESGVNRLNAEGGFTRFTTENGLPGNAILQLVSDSRGLIWITTDRGLARLDPRDETIAGFEPAPDRRPFRFGPFAACATQRGTLVFGGPEGVLLFHPEQVREEGTPPPVRFTEFRIFNRSVPIGADSPLRNSISETDAIELTYRDHLFSFAFSALDYRAPERNIYSCIMEGFHEEWVDLGTRNFVEFTNLEPGDYTFRVRGAGSGGVWNQEGASIRVTIMPPFWETFWFRSLAAAGAIAFLGLIYRTRLRTLQREKAYQEQFARQLIQVQDAERKRIASELHDSIGQSLLIISNTAQLHIGKKNLPGESVTDLREISETARQAIEEVREISYDLHPHQLDRLGLDKALEGIISRLRTSTDLMYSFEADPIDRLVAKQDRIHIFRIVQEALTNILKHAAASSVGVSVKETEDGIRISVHDDGKGFKPGQRGTEQGGLGLKGIAERVKVLDGQLRIDSSPGEGCSIVINLPVDRHAT